MSDAAQGSPNAAGLPPGTLVYTGQYRDEPTRVRVLDYSPEGATEEEGLDVERLATLRDAPRVTWVDVTGLSDTEAVAALGDVFAIHPLILEDVLQSEGRPKVENHGDVIVIIAKVGHLDVWEQGRFDLEEEHVAIVLGQGFVVTFQERPRDPFEQVRARILAGIGQIRRRRSGWLAYALLDALVDHYFPVMTQLGTLIEDLEEELLVSLPDDASARISDLRTANVVLARAVRPLRDVARALPRLDTRLIGKKDEPYLRDLFDHCTLVLENADLHRDMVMGLVDLHQTSTTNRLNDRMKVLTIVSTVFIPLTFIAGVYGMNFRWMPETEWWGSYFVALGVMTAIGLGLLLVFKLRRWF